MRTYRSVRILSEFSADAIRGRATRVFEAYEINRDGQRVEGSKNLSTKDYWVDNSREAEPVIVKKILEGANESMKATYCYNAVVTPSIYNLGIFQIRKLPFPIHDEDIP